MNTLLSQLNHNVHLCLFDKDQELDGGGTSNSYNSDELAKILADKLAAAYEGGTENYNLAEILSKPELEALIRLNENEEEWASFTQKVDALLEEKGIDISINQDGEFELVETKLTDVTNYIRGLEADPLGQELHGSGLNRVDDRGRSLGLETLTGANYVLWNTLKPIGSTNLTTRSLYEAVAKEMGADANIAHLRQTMNRDSLEYKALVRTGKLLSDLANLDKGSVVVGGQEILLSPEEKVALYNDVVTFTYDFRTQMYDQKDKAKAAVKAGFSDTGALKSVLQSHKSAVLPESVTALSGAIGERDFVIEFEGQEPATLLNEEAVNINPTHFLATLGTFAGDDIVNKVVANANNPDVLKQPLGQVFSASRVDALHKAMRPIIESLNPDLDYNAVKEQITLADLVQVATIRQVAEQSAETLPNLVATLEEAQQEVLLSILYERTEFEAERVSFLEKGLENVNVFASFGGHWISGYTPMGTDPRTITRQAGLGAPEKGTYEETVVEGTYIPLVKVGVEKEFPLDNGDEIGVSVSASSGQFSTGSPKDLPMGFDASRRLESAGGMFDVFGVEVAGRYTKEPFTAGVKNTTLIPRAGKFSPEKLAVMPRNITTVDVQADLIQYTGDTGAYVDVSAATGLNVFNLWNKSGVYGDQKDTSTAELFNRAGADPQQGGFSTPASWYSMLYLGTGFGEFKVKLGAGVTRPLAGGHGLEPTVDFSANIPLWHTEKHTDKVNAALETTSFYEDSVLVGSISEFEYNEKHTEEVVPKENPKALFSLNHDDLTLKKWSPNDEKVTPSNKVDTPQKKF